MRALLFLALLTGSAYASADREPDNPPTDDADSEDTEPVIPDESRVLGPFKSVDEYCAARIAARPDGAQCTTDNARDGLPADRTSGVLRAVRFVTLDESTHVVVQTLKGWFGYSIESPGPGDSLELGEVAFRNVVGDSEAELYFESGTTHAPCGCDDLWHTTITATICRVDDGELACSKPVEKHEDMHLVDIYEWAADWRIRADGLVTPKLRDTKNISKRQRRALAKPFRLRFTNVPARP
jgi:hypothetical protein